MVNSSSMRLAWGLVALLTLSLTLLSCKNDEDDGGGGGGGGGGGSTLLDGPEVTNSTLTTQDATGNTVVLNFNVAWAASWRNDIMGAGYSAPYNYDGLWIFAKYRINGTGAWGHCTVETSVTPAPAGFVFTDPTDLRGTFLHRNANGSGDVSLTGVQIRWNYGVDGVADGATVDVQVYTLEVVYIPQGAFFVGDGSTGAQTDGAAMPQALPIEGQFCQAGGTAPFQITSEAAITLGGTLPSYLSVQGTTSDDFNSTTLGTLPAAFPKGFNAYWIMKYELQCQQWCDFLNKLAPAQQTVHDTTVNFGTERHGITVTSGVYNTPVPTRAVNFMNYNDMLAFADWSAMRPFTELEYEKAGRGTLAAVPDEYAWGAATTNITQITGFTGTDGSGTETALPTSANCQYNLTSGVLGGSAINGPVRVGIFRATNPTGTRLQTGAGYYWVYELTGNVWERPVTIHTAAARTFDGHAGDGALDANGLANELTWPNISGGGAGYRGGNWFRGTAWGRLSSRAQATNHDPTGRTSHRGIRVARTAP